MNLDLPGRQHQARSRSCAARARVLYGAGAYLGVINIVTESVDTFRRDELTLGGGSFETFLYNFRYGTTFHEVSLAGFLQYSYTGGPELDVPRDAADRHRPRARPAGHRARVARARARPWTTARRVDANLALAYRDFGMRHAPEEGERGRLRRPARRAGRSRTA